MLPVDLHQRLRQTLEEGEGRVAVVQEDAAPTAAHQLTSDDELAVLEREPVLPEDGRHRALLRQREHALDDGGIRPGPDRLARLDALAEEEGEGLDQDRFPRARLAREDVEAGGEGNGQGVDDREVADSQLFEHPRRPPSLINVRPILAWSSAPESMFSGGRG